MSFDNKTLRRIGPFFAGFVLLNILTHPTVNAETSVDVEIIDTIDNTSDETSEVLISIDDAGHAPVDQVFDDVAPLYRHDTYKVPLAAGESTADRMKSFYDRELLEWAGVPEDHHELRMQNKVTFRVLPTEGGPEVITSDNYDPENVELRRRLGLTDDQRFYHQVLVNGYYNTAYFSGQRFIQPSTVYEAFETRGQVSEQLMRMMEGEYLRSRKAYDYFEREQSWTDHDYSLWRQIDSCYTSLKYRYLSNITGVADVGFVVDADAKISSEDLTALKDAVNRLPYEWSKRLGAIHITGERYNRIHRLNGILGGTTTENVIELNGDYRSLVATLYHEASHVLDFQSMYFSKTHNAFRSISRLASFATPYKYFIQNDRYGFTSYYKNNVAEAFAQVLSNYYVDDKFSDEELKSFGTVDFVRGDSKSTRLNHYAKRYVEMFKSRYLKIKK